MIEACSKDLNVQQFIDLKSYNSLAITATEYFCTVENLAQLKAALSFASKNLKITPIGGGSNLVLASDVSGLVVHINLTGVTSQSLLMIRSMFILLQVRMARDGKYVFR